MAAQNRVLGSFQLTGIPPAPRGVPQIGVSFDIDANGILNVSAKDKGTGKEQSIVIKSSSGLSEEEVERMRKDAEAHAEEDSLKKAIVEARNQAEARIYEAEKALKEHEDRVEAADRSAIEKAMEDLKAVKDGEDAKAIESKVEALTAATHAMAQKMYQKTAAGAGAGSSQGGGPADEPDPGAGTEDEKIIDADFEVKD
jgi:molecular chaperone DnaK